MGLRWLPCGNADNQQVRYDMLNLRNQIRVHGSTVQPGAPFSRSSLVASMGGAAAGQSRRETANYFPGGGGSVISQIPVNPATQDLLMSGLASESDSSLYKFYNDIYQYDSIAGPYVDLMANIPFSSFELLGIEDKEMRQVFERSIERLDLENLFPELVVDYLVDGKFTATPLFSRDDKAFTDLVIHDAANLDFIYSPLRNIAPVITVRQSAAAQEFLASDNETVIDIRSKINPRVLDALAAQECTLDQVTTVYVPRKTYAHNQVGTSVFRRLLPIYFLEKTLYKGTLTEFGRRQRAIMHMMMGDDTWEPTGDEMNQGVRLFQRADLDPINAIVATRNGIQINEVRAGGDFLKWTDVANDMAAMKMRALGSSDAFLSGDSSYGTSETAMQIFLQGALGLRNRVTHAFFYSRLFPSISHLNGFREKDATGARGDASSRKLDRLIIPRIRWHKSLAPQADEARMETLEKLKEHGVPVTYRAQAAAAGENIDDMMADWRNEQAIRTEIGKIKEETGVSVEESSILARVLGMGRRRNMLGRDFGDAGEIVGRTRTGKAKRIYNQTKAQNEANARIIAALETLSDPNNAAQISRMIIEKNLAPHPANTPAGVY